MLLHAPPVPDSHSKLVTAVTRARVDHPSFLCYSAPSQSVFEIRCFPGIGSYASRAVLACEEEPSKSGASVWDNQEKPVLATVGLDPDGLKCTALR